MTMADDDRTPAALTEASVLERRIDDVAEAVADLDARLAQMTSAITDLGPKVNELLDRHPASLGSAASTTAAVAGDVAASALEPVHAALADLRDRSGDQHVELARTLDVLEPLAARVERLESSAGAQLEAAHAAAAAAAQAASAAEAARAASVQSTPDPMPVLALDDIDGALAASEARTAARVDDLNRALGDLAASLPSEAADVHLDLDIDGPISAAVDGLVERIANHTDTALAGMLRVLDGRLESLRAAVTTAIEDAAPASIDLAPRLDAEFGSLRHQLLQMADVLDAAAASAEVAATRPAVTGDQLRQAAASVKDSVANLRRGRASRRWEPPALGPGAD